MSRETMRISQMYANWINGNRKDVIAEFSQMHPLDAAQRAVIFATRLESSDRDTFLRMLENATPHTFMPASPAQG